MIDSLNNQTDSEGQSDENLSPIKKFFTNANVFLTGGTGFLGMLLLEKLLFACPNISNIYMLVRSKKGKYVQTRLEELFDDVVFARLREQYPNFREKIFPIEGDCELPNLGLSIQDRVLLITEVNIVIHAAATVRFDESLKKASIINVRAVRDIMRLAQRMPNLKSLVHVSTAFSNCTHSHIKEEVYPPARDYKKLLLVTEALPDDILTRITPLLLENYPNTYSFTKQVGEDVVRQEGAGLPAGIHRPSIVQSTYKEPVRGWTNNFYGPTGYLVGGGLGLMRTAEIYSDVKANMVPADMVVNSIIATAWDIAERFAGRDQKGNEVPVYNFEASHSPILTWEDYIKICGRFAYRYSSVHAMWYMFFIPTRNRISYVIAAFFLHKIPAFVVDAVRFCLRKPPILLRVYKKIDKMVDVSSYFILKEWSFESENVPRLKTKMYDEDRTTFFCDMKDFEWEEYLEYCVRGIRIYLIKDPLETIPVGQKRFRRLYWIHQFTKTVVAALSLWISWCFCSLTFGSVL
ncbi:fatty acyl-CoA reductase wat-like [Anoplophora glabripennis]|uniref:fatty acyl-CoA reductase wat-like n=1 Tax=Anoplophora glabripennis TaxID=217634 RepID=UPI000874FB8C|nr:fatty acyl-CoA reductase wat-like [Anoplophora glabripennis]